ncbi:MAG: phage baseplate protein [Lacrimispora sphenoides]
MEKLKIGGLVFDAILKTDHNSKVTATSHPIESGASISDHAFVEPVEISIELAVSDSERNRGTFGSGNRSVKAFQELTKLQRSRKLITVVTRFKTYSNMLIMSVSTPDDYITMNAFRAMVILKEIPVVSTHTVSITARATSSSTQVQKTGSTNSGTKQAAEPKQSILKQTVGKLLG